MKRETLFKIYFAEMDWAIHTSCDWLELHTDLLRNLQFLPQRGKLKQRKQKGSHQNQTADCQRSIGKPQTLISNLLLIYKQLLLWFMVPGPFHVYGTWKPPPRKEMGHPYVADTVKS